MFTCSKHCTNTCDGPHCSHKRSINLITAAISLSRTCPSRKEIRPKRRKAALCSTLWKKNKKQQRATVATVATATTLAKIIHCVALEATTSRWAAWVGSQIFEQRTFSDQSDHTEAAGFWQFVWQWSIGKQRWDIKSDGTTLLLTLLYYCLSLCLHPICANVMHTLTA